MNLVEINDKIEKINNAWEHYKSVNDARLREIETKGSADPLTEEQLSKINNEIDENKAKLKSLELSLLRPSNEVKSSKVESSVNLEYKNAFNNYIRKGIDAPLANLEVKANLTSEIASSSANGGYFLAPNMQKIITGEMQDRCVMRQICSVQEISTSSLDVIDDTSFNTSWNSETGAVSDTASSTLSRMSISTHDLIAQPQVTQKLIDDASINIEEWLAYRLADQFIQAEETAFISGTSDNNQPNGILKYAAGNSATDTIETVTSASATAITTNEILKLFYSLKAQYVNRASFLMARTTVQEIRKLQDPTSKHYLWQPAVLAGQDDMLLGCPVYQSTNIDAIAANKAVIILGDFKQYQIVDRAGIRILRDPYTSKPYIRFYTTKRVGGDVIRKEAFKVLRTKSA